MERGGSTYFAGLSRRGALAVFALVVGLLALAAAPYHPRQVAHHARPGDTDRQLYRDIEARVEHGQDYYAAALAEHRAHGAPTHPAMAIREPTLTSIIVGLGGEKPARVALITLALAAAGLTWWTLLQMGLGGLARLSAVGLQLIAMGHCFAPGGVYSHESWAALLIVASLATYRLGFVPLAFAAALAACLVRELAFPYVLAMAAFAALERRWRELVGWALVAALFAGLYFEHALLAANAPLSTDQDSPGWLWLGGWPFVVEATRNNFLLILFPAWVAGLVAALSLLGLVGARDPWLSRISLIVGGYMAAFMFIGRPDNGAWGLLYAPLLPFGMIYAPAALRDLFGRLRTG